MKGVGSSLAMGEDTLKPILEDTRRYKQSHRQKKIIHNYTLIKTDSFINLKLNCLLFYLEKEVVLQVCLGDDSLISF